MLKNPSEAEVSELLMRAGASGLRGLEDYSGNVFLWPYNEGTHMLAASMLGIFYDPASDYVDKLTGKTFYIRSLDDWRTRERLRAKPDSFTSRCRLAPCGPTTTTSGNRSSAKRDGEP
jgi:hypothetical protein